MAHESLSDDEFPAIEQDKFSRLVTFTRRELSVSGNRTQEQLFAPDAWAAIEQEQLETPYDYYDN